MSQTRVSGKIFLEFHVLVKLSKELWEENSILFFFFSVWSFETLLPPNTATDVKLSVWSTGDHGVISGALQTQMAASAAAVYHGCSLLSILQRARLWWFLFFSGSQKTAFWSNIVVLAVVRASCDAPPLFPLWRGDPRGMALRVVACLPAETSLADSLKIRSCGTRADPLPHSTPGVPRRQSMFTTAVLSDFTTESFLSNLTYFASVKNPPQSVEVFSGLHHASAAVCTERMDIVSIAPVIRYPVCCVQFSHSFRNASLHLSALLNKASSHRQISFGCSCRSHVTAFCSMDSLTVFSWLLISLECHLTA